MAVPDVAARGWAGLRPRFDALEKDPAPDLTAWLARYSTLSAALSEAECRRYAAMTRHTDDPAKTRAHLYFQTRVLPRCKPRWQALKRKLLAHPGLRGLPRDYAVFLKHTRNEAALFRKANVALEAREAALVQRYQKRCGAQTVTFDGREQTLPMLSKVLEETDRSRRQAAWEAVARRRLRDRHAIDGLFDRLFSLRTRIARNAGFRNFRDYAFRRMGRFDYTPADCMRFHKAVEKTLVPALRARQARRAERLGVGTLRPWDLAVDPLGRPPLKPYATTAELVAGCRRIFGRVHPDFGRKFDRIRAKGYLDLESRKGKAPGGYMCGFDAERMPFIFVNGAGRHQDVQTLLHEGGHAFHTLLAYGQDFHFNQGYPIEFAEVASMGMELLAAPHLDAFYAEADARRAREQHLEAMLDLFAWIATIDAFQHQVYLGQDRQAAWAEVRQRFKGADDWTGYGAEHAALWQRQGHLFGSPFYYIEYAIAQLGALQLWVNAGRDRRKAIARYRAALSLGWTKPLPELFKAAGLRFDFSERTLAPLVEAVMRELACSTA